MTFRRVMIYTALTFALSFALVTSALAANWPSDTPTQTDMMWLFPNTNGYFIHPYCLTSDPKYSCGLAEIVLTAINITKAILAVVGSVTLLVFMYGGFLWLTSAGNAEQIKKGRTVFVNALVGLAIIFGSTIIINFVVAALTGQDLGGTINLFPKGNSQPVLQVPTQTQSQQ